MMTYETIITGHSDIVTEQIYNLVEKQEKIKKKKTITLLDEYKIAVLYQLQKKGVLTPSQVYKLVYSHNTSKRNTERSLKSLKDQNLIDCHPYFMGNKGRMESVYFLTKKGFSYLQDCQIPEFEEEEFSYKQAPMTIANYVHRRATTDFWIQLEQETNKSNAYEIIEAVPEWLQYNNENIVMRFGSLKHEKQLTLKPDFTFIVRNLETFIESLFFVEVDMSTETIIGKKSLESRFYKYQQAFSQLAFQNINPYFRHFSGARILLVTNSTTRAKSILQKIKIHADLQQAFIISTFEEVKQRGIIETIKSS